MECVHEVMEESKEVFEKWKEVFQKCWKDGRMEGVQEALEEWKCLRKVFEKLGLRMSLEKTQMMRMDSREREELDTRLGEKNIK